MAGTSAKSSLDLDVVTRRLGDQAGIYRINALAACDSTNTQLMADAEAGASGGSVLVADRQTAGRGRRGRLWHASAGDSLTFSLLWRFADNSPAPAGLSLTVGLAVATALESLGVHGIRLKWPNDVLHGGRKLAGILIELQPGRLHSVVIGIGLNLRLPTGLPDEVARTAMALEEVLHGPQREAVLAAILSELAGTLARYERDGFAPLRATWCARDAYAGRQVSIVGENIRQSGICAGVDSDGALLLRDASGVTRIIAGEVSLRDIAGHSS